MFSALSKSIAASILTLFSAIALAHEGGHGPKIEGVGPAGGKLTAVVAASDIEKGEAAPVAAIVEWKIDGGKIETMIWDEKLKSPMFVEAQGELRWILVLQAPETARVYKVKLTDRLSKLEITLDKDLVEKATVIEAILPNFNDKQTMHVFAFSPHKRLIPRASPAKAGESIPKKLETKR